MGTLLYQPGIRVYIHSAQNGIIDVSEDLVNAELVRRSDGVSTFNFTITNPRRVYDSLFAPNDRIVVMMKRVTWMRVFTGLLNSVPLFSVWPRDVDLRASCSLKRLQYWYWDPYSTKSTQLLKKVTSELSNGGGADRSDMGMAHIATRVLGEVVGWPKEKIHIGEIPKNWVDIAYQVAKDLKGPLAEADTAAKQVMDRMVGGYIGESGGGYGATSADGASAPAALNGKLADGSYGGVGLKGEQLRNAEMIYATGVGMGMSDRDCLLALMCSMQEATLRNLSGGDRDSVGTFQQRPSMGWGTVAQCMNVNYAATQFYKALKKVSNRDKMRETEAIQKVQRSGFPEAYQKWLNMGKALMSRLVTLKSSDGGSDDGSDGGGAIGGAESYGGGTSSSGAFGSNTVGAATPGGELGGVSGPLVGGDSIGGTRGGGSSSGLPTGASMAMTARDFLSKHPRHPYAQIQKRSFADMMREPPPLMDCSMFVSSMMARTLGKLPDGYCFPKASEMAKWALNNGGKKVSIEEAANTPGAWLFVVNSSRPDHVGLSLGGGNIAQTASTQFPAAVYPLDFISYWTMAVLPPGFQYEQGAIPLTPGMGGDGSGSGGGLTAIKPIPPELVAYSETEGFNKDDQFSGLFGSAMWMPSGIDQAAQDLSISLVGPRALMNDQPMLPYIKNLMYTSMRSFCSAPNGDLIGWFPDYYGLFGQAAKLIIEPIELQDFTVEWSDDTMVTHQFVSVTQAGSVIFDIASGQVTDPRIFLTASKNENSTMAGDMRPFTSGVATIDMPGLLTALFGVKQDETSAKKFADFIYKRFGARPAYEEMPGLTGPTQAFFGAIYRFMNNWGYQYNANIPTTFMPEAWPGMLVQIPEYGFQAYITTVTHSISMVQGGGFNTSMNISNPARLRSGMPGGKPDVFMGLPTAGAREGASIDSGIVVGNALAAGAGAAANIPGLGATKPPSKADLAKNPSLNKPRVTGDR